jgi:hypothetical protein
MLHKHKSIKECLQINIKNILNTKESDYFTEWQNEVVG